MRRKQDQSQEMRREVLKSRELPKYKISPTEVLQDPNNAMPSSDSVSRGTQARPNAWAIKVIEEVKPEDLKAKRSMTAISLLHQIMVTCLRQKSILQIQPEDS